MESQTHHKMKEKGILKQKPRKDLVVEDYVEESEEEEELGFRNDEDKKRKSVIKRGSNCGIGVSPPCCQIDKCNSDLTDAKPYHRRHKVCEFHSKAPVVVVAGTRQRFCQQCSRFHELSEFDETKRSCRRRLAGHNERRRKSSSESHGEGSNRERMDPQLKESNCRGTDSSVKIRISLSGNGKHSQIR